jgi:hypothetical protein
MKTSKNKDTRFVFVAKNLETAGVIEDEVVKVGDDKFKSIKFRHTYYTESDFSKDLHEIENYIKRKLGIITQSLS